MIRKATPLLGLAFVFLTSAIPFLSNAQTTTFTYKGSGLSTSSSSAFSPAVSISGYSHSAILGGVTFDGTNLNLNTTPTASPAGGTAYAITYQFTPGTQYTIAITGLSGTGVSLKAYVYPTTPSWANANETAPDGNISYLGTGTSIGNVFGVTSSSATYTLATFNPSGAMNCLVIGASGGADDLSTLSISKVVITAVTKPQFTLTPTSLSLTCGDVSARTFTVTNPQSIAGTLSYSWNVGSGWLYNGSAPSGPVTTAGSSITLTPVNTKQSVPGNISVGVSTNGNLYNTYTCAVTQSNTAPSLSISETNAGAPVCNGTSQGFTLSTPPAGASVAWSISPASGLGTLSASGNQATVSYAGNGMATLTASVSNTCGTWSYQSSPIQIGTHTPTNLSGITPGEAFPPNGVGEFFSSDGNLWTIETGGTITGGQGTHDIGVRIANVNNGYIVVEVASTNACGTSAALTREGVIKATNPPPPAPLSIGNSSPLSGRESADASSSAVPGIYPSPAHSSIRIVLPQTDPAGVTIRIYDMNGRLLKTIAPHNQSTQVDVSQWAAGLYITEISDGKHVTTKKWVKQ